MTTSNKKLIRVGSRGSDLALTQTHHIIDLLSHKNPNVTFEVVEIITHGDRFGETPITAMGEHLERGIFNTGLEQAILKGEVDFATCSFKDVESELPEGLLAVSVDVREDPRDVLVTRGGKNLADLPSGATLATSSPRRTSQLTAFRPDFAFKPLRGNIPTRVGAALDAFDGVIVAAAGLVRLGLDAKISEWIPTDVLLPAPAQGALGCEFLAMRADIAGMIAGITHKETQKAVMAEKKLLVTLSGGCFAPIGALAKIEGENLSLQCRIVSLDGKKNVQAETKGPQTEVEKLIESLAEELQRQGGGEIIEETRKALEG